MTRTHRLLLASGAAAALVSGTVATLPASAATTGCSVSYTVQSQWPGGFTAAVAIENLGSAVTSWTLAYDFPTTGQKINQGWSASWAQAGTRVTANNASWNGSLGTGATTSIGFTGAWSGTNPVPDSFSLNGTRCTGSVLPPTSSPTSVPPSPPPSTPPPTGPAPELSVSGNRIVTAE